MCVQEGYTINTVTVKCFVTYSLLFWVTLRCTQTHTETIRCFFCSNSLVSLQVCTAAECQIVFSSQRKAMDLVSGIWLVCVDVWVCVSVSCVSAWLHTGAWMSHMVRACDAIGWCWVLARFLFPLVSRGDWSYRTGVTVLAATVHVCVCVFDATGCAARAGAKGGHSWAVPPPNRVTVTPTFNPLPSLLNVIDLESESETDKTAHIRKQLHTLVSISNCTAITDGKLVTRTSSTKPPLTQQWSIHCMLLPMHNVHSTWTGGHSVKPAETFTNPCSSVKTRHYLDPCKNRLQTWPANTR